jgi:integrase
MGIEKRGEFSYRVTIRKHGIQPINKTFNTLTDARRWERQTLVELDQGNFKRKDESAKMTLHEALVKYDAEIASFKKSYDSEKYKIRNLLKHPSCQITLSNLRASDFAAWRDEMLKSGKAPQTVNLHLGILSHVFSVAEKDWGFEINNPLLKIRKPKVKNGRTRRLEADEYEYLLKAAKLSSFHALPDLIQLAVETAMRQGEILQLQWKFINLKSRVLILPSAVTKTDTERHVPLSSIAVRIIDSIPRQLKSQKLFHGISRWTASEQYKLACERGRKKYFEEKGFVSEEFLINLRFHDLRHEAASRLFECGKFDTMEVAAITGHKTLQMLKRYTHLKAEDLARKLA